MKRIYALTVVVLMVLSLTGCGKSEFGVTENTEKRMVITAERAAKDSFFMVGTLQVDDGEQIEIASNLKKGEVKVEIVAVPEEQSIETPPETDSEPVIMANVKTTEGASGTLPPGSYMMRATCTEKATGTIDVSVVPAP